MARLTMRDVADRAGVSLGTVSNVLNKPDLVASDTRERVMAAIQEIGFVRNDAARQLRGGKAQAIGLVTLDIDNPFFTEVARGVEAAADETNLMLFLCSSAGSLERENKQLRSLEEQRVAGILMSPLERNPSRNVRDIRDRGTPVVLLDRHRSTRQWCSVSVNDTRGAQLVAEHLVELGHQQIGLLNGPINLKPCFERRESFVATLAQHGLEIAEARDVEAPAMTIEAGVQAAAELFEGKAGPPTALFCTNDLLALGAERAALSRGIPIPEQISIVGYDDIRYAETSLVPLTTVRNPAFELGYEATRLLVDEATEGPDHKHRRLLLEPALVVRSSTSATSGNGRKTSRHAAKSPARAKGTAAR